MKMVGTTSRWAKTVVAMALTAIAATLVVAAAPLAHADNAGQPDFRWGRRAVTEMDFGNLDKAQKAALDGAGRTVVVGWSEDGPDHATVTRLLPQHPSGAGAGTVAGVHDTSFDPPAPYETGDGFQLTDSVPFGSVSTLAYSRFHGVDVDGQGRIVAVGMAAETAGVDRGLVARLLPDGSLDGSFDGGGVLFNIDDASLGVPDTLVARDVVIDDGDNLYVVGEAVYAGVPRGFLTKLRGTDGSVDLTFGTNGVVLSTVAYDRYTAVATNSPNGATIGVAGSNGDDEDVIVDLYHPAGTLLGSQRYKPADPVPSTEVYDIVSDNVTRYAGAAGLGFVVVGSTTNGGVLNGFASRVFASGAMDTAWNGGGLAHLVSTAGRPTEFFGVDVSASTIAIAGNLQAGDGGDITLFALSPSGTPLPLGTASNLTGTATDARALQGLARINENTSAAVIQPDGNVLIIGDHIHNSATKLLLSPAPGNDPGSAVTEFSGDGKVDAFAAINAVEVDDAQTAWMVGSTAANEWAVGRVTADGTTTTLSTSVPWNEAPGYFPLSAASDIDSDATGRKIVAGDAGTGADTRRPLLARFEADGSIDTSFGDGGYVTLVPTNPYTGAVMWDNDARFSEVVVLGDGNIVAAGLVESNDGDDGDALVAKFTPDGKLDPTFGTSGVHRVAGPITNGYDGIGGLTITPDGGFVTAGWEQVDANADNARLVATKYLRSGTLDPAFGTAGRATVEPGAGSIITNANDAGANGYRAVGLVTTPDGKLRVAATSQGCATPGDRQITLVGLAPDGSVDTNFGSAGVVRRCLSPYDFTNDISIAPDGDLILVGAIATTLPPAATNQQAIITKFLSDGSTDFGFGVGGAEVFGQPSPAYEVLNAAAITPDGRILLGGTRVNGTESFGYLQKLVGDAPPRPFTAAESGRIVYGSNRSGRFDLWEVDRNGEHDEPLTTRANQPGRYAASPTFSPSGAEIAFQSVDEANTFDSDVRKRNTSGAFVGIASEPAAYEADPNWSPDGTRIVFVSDNAGPTYLGGGAQPFDLWTMNADGSGKTRVTTSPQYDTQPSWSPDGSMIIFERAPFQGAPSDIWIREMTGPNAGTEHQVTTGVDAKHASFGFGGTVGFAYVDLTSDPDGSAPCVALTTATPFVYNPVCYDNGGPGLGADFPIVRPTFDPEDPQELLYASNGLGRTQLRVQKITSGSLDVPIQHTATTMGRFDTIENLSITTNVSSVSLSPSSIPVGDIPTQADSANTQTKFDGAGLPILNLVKTPLPILNLVKTGLPILNLVKTPVADGLRRTTLAEAPLLRPGGWEAFIADLPGLAGRPLQSLTLYDVLDALSRHPGHATFRLEELQLEGTAFGQISALALSMAGLPVRSIERPLDICTYVKARSDAFANESCADIESLSLADLQVAGVDLSELTQLEGLTIGELRYARNDTEPGWPGGRPVLTDFRLSDMQLDVMNLGQIRLDAAPFRNAITDCASCDTLAEAFAQNAIKPTATFNDLGHATDGVLLNELITGFLPSSYSPIDKVPTEQLGIEGYRGDAASTSSVQYTVSFRPLTATTTLRGNSVIVDLPDDFTYIPGSAQFVSRPNAVGTNIEAGPVTPTVLDGNRLQFATSRRISGQGSIDVTFSVRPGLDPSPAQSVSASVEGAGYAQDVAGRSGVVVQDPFEPANDAIATALDVRPDRLYVNHVLTATDRDFYRLTSNSGSSTLTAGTVVKATLSQGNGDADLVVYGPPGLTSAQALRQIKQQATPVVPVGDPGNLRNSGEPLTSETLQDVPIENRPVVAISTNRGTDNDVVEFVVPATGVYYAQISPFNGVPSGSAQSFRYQAADPVAPPACAARSGYSPGSSGQATPTAASVSGKTSLFLVNEGRLRASYPDATVTTMLDRLATLAARPEVNGAIVTLDGFASVRNATGFWDQNACSPDAANALVRAINDAVDSLYPNGLDPALVRNIVLVGNDEMLPFARIPDLTQQTNERGYSSALAFTGSNNALKAAFDGGFQLSDDPYGDASPSPYLGRYLYVSDTAISRLGETPAEAADYLQSYLTANGVLDQATAVTAGYDFMRDTAAAIDGGLGRAIPAGGRTVLDDDDATPAAPFTKANLANALGTNPDVAAVQAHYDHAALLPGVGATTNDLYRTSDLGSVDRSRGVFFTMGCHSGLNVADILVANPTTAEAARLRDWVQTLGSQKATYVGQTGYGVGLEYTLSLSEKILADFAGNLATQGVTVGDALKLAKQRYLGAIGVYGVYDEKVLNEATLYGLPFWKLATGAAPVPPAPPAPTTVDPATGLDTIRIASDPSFATRDVGDDGRFLTASHPGAVSNDPLTVIGRPIQPKLELDVTQPGQQVGDVLITELTSDDTLTGFNPVVARQVVDDSDNETEIDSSTVLFPSTIAGTNSYRDGSGPRSSAVIVPGQFKATGSQADGQTIGVQRRYTHVAGTVFYSNAADKLQPTIARTTVGRLGDDAVFDVFTTDLEPGGVPGVIKRVVLMARDANDAVWTRVELANDPSEPSHWSGTLSVDRDEVEYIAQAVDRHGNIGVTANKGFLASVVPAPESPRGVVATSDGPSTPDASSGWTTGATVTLEGAEGVTFTYLVDQVGQNGSSTPFTYTAPFTVTDEGLHRVDWRASSGETGYLYVAVDTAAPTATIQFPTAGQRVKANAPGNPVYSCSDTGSGIKSCSATIDTSSPAGQDSSRTVRVDAVDNAGRSSTTSVTFVADGTPPTVTITSPVDGASYAVGQQVTPSVTCTSDGGPAPVCTYPATVDTATPGTKTFVVHSEDAVGNVTDRTVTYTVTASTTLVFEGFFSPVANPPTVNTQTAGQTIPVKWRLKTSTGTPVTSTATVKEIKVVSYLCGTSTAITSTTVAASAVTYEDGGFAWKWKTDKMQRGCYRVDVVFQPNTGVGTKSALFNFTK